MRLIYKPNIPKGISGILTHLTYIMFSGPAFLDEDFIGRDLPMAFYELNEALGLIRSGLGEERHAHLIELSNLVRAHFEADPEDKTGQALKGRELIVFMEEILKQSS